MAILRLPFDPLLVVALFVMLASSFRIGFVRTAEVLDSTSCHGLILCSVKDLGFIVRRPGDAGVVDARCGSHGSPDNREESSIARFGRLSKTSFNPS